MCRYCDYTNIDCAIFIEPLTKEWYYSHRTDEWDEEAQEWIYDRIYIGYCPWCGRSLYEYKKVD